jgi:apolipoprotein N-acyltransferase
LTIAPPTPARRRAGLALVAILASAGLLGLYARGGAAFALGFVALLPWLLLLNRLRNVGAVVLAALGMSIAFVAAVFSWFGHALHAYTGIGVAASIALLCASAPLLQPQLLVFAVVRHLTGRRHGPALRTLAAAAAWVATEALWPKLLGDTLGHGLHAASHLRQVADLGGAAALTLALLLVNEAATLAIERRRDGARAWLVPLLIASVLPAAMSGYGMWRLGALRAATNEPVATLRIGLVQSGIVDYERLRAELGSYAAVRQILDTHFALSRAAIEHHGADVLLWSETVYPTTFAQPRSDDGAAFDREILDFTRALGVPLVFGTYDRDAQGEYNAAAFVEPERGLLGFYRKTHPFPLTEYVPDWLDGPRLRHWLPWLGSWRPGDGARVLPLRLADGRELDVVPLICLDDVRPALALDGARLGAQAIVGLSNDAWFTARPIGARLHLTVAAFRSIETRLPQLRVTSNGLSAMIDPSGEIVASTAMGDRAVLAGEIPLRAPPSTLMVRWGDWVGRAGAVFLLGLGVWTLIAARASRAAPPVTAAAFVAETVLLDPRLRVATASLRLVIGAGLLWLGARLWLVDGWQVNSLVQLRLFALLVVAPAVVLALIEAARAARVTLGADHLLLQQRRRRIEIPLARISTVRRWRLPLPDTGLDLQLASGRRWEQGLSGVDPVALQRALVAAGATTRLDADGVGIGYAALRARRPRRWYDRTWFKFIVFPLLPALPAFRLHQHIAFGGSFGELQTYGLGAWLSGLGLWWVSWALGLVLLAAALRVAIELVSLAALTLRPSQAGTLRTVLVRLGRGVFYLGVPLWLVWRLMSG